MSHEHFPQGFDTEFLKAYSAATKEREDQAQAVVAAVERGQEPRASMPIPLLLTCPACGARHIDVGDMFSDDAVHRVSNNVKSLLQLECDHPEFRARDLARHLDVGIGYVAKLRCIGNRVRLAILDHWFTADKPLRMEAMYALSMLPLSQQATAYFLAVRWLTGLGALVDESKSEDEHYHGKVIRSDQV
jgi:hypothetical protein